MKHVFKFLVLMFFLTGTLEAWTQTITVTGKVTDENQEGFTWR